MDRPVVSFVLVIYNHEQYIRESICGALSQTYSPLEIIISDDKSMDKSFEIAEQLVAGYNGPHKVVLNRNEKNLGIGGHINRVMSICKGELIVLAAGDDISMANRVEVLVKRWVELGKKPFSIYSKAEVIDEHGNELGVLDSPPVGRSLEKKINSYMSGSQGSTQAWSREVFEIFGPLLPGTVCEDRVIPLRSELLGGIEYLPETLVKYRIHQENISHFHWKKEDEIIDVTISIFERNINILENYIKDLESAKALKLKPDLDLSKLQSITQQKMEKLIKKRDFLLAGVAGKLVIIIKNMLVDPKQAMKWMLILIFPSMYLRTQKRNLGIS